MFVLVVDDHPDIANVVCYLLELDHHQVEIVTGGEEALKYLHSHHPDLVVLDVQMPGMDGIQTLKRMKADRRSQDIPVVLHTAGQVPANRAEALRLGASGLIKKGSTSVSELIAIVQDAALSTTHH